MSTNHEEMLCVDEQLEKINETEDGELQFSLKNTEADEQNQQRKRPQNPTGSLHFFASFSFILGIAVSWACATQFRKSVMMIDQEHVFAPFFMVWFGTTFMLLCYPTFLCFHSVVAKGNVEKIRAEHRNSLEVFERQKFRGNCICRVLLFLSLWTASNYAYSFSLGSSVSASAATSIMSANSAIVYVLEWTLLGERFSILKTAATALAIIGVVVVSFDAEFAGSAAGISLVVASAFFAAFYKVLFKKLHANASLGQVSLFMSSLGAANLLINGLIAGGLLFAGVDRLELAFIPWLPLLGSALLGLVFNFLVNFGVVLISPLVVSIGMLFGIPLSAAIDLLFRSMLASSVFLCGSALISLSFLLIAFPVEWKLSNFFSKICSARKKERKIDNEGDEEMR